MKVRAIVLAACGIAGILGVCPVLAQAPPEAPRFSFGGLPNLGSLRSLTTMLRRTDVQTSIGMDLKQKQALADMIDPAKRQPMKLTFNSADGNDPEAMRKKLQDQVNSMQNDTNAKIKSVLRPEQFDRLVAIDLQWRGALALADSKVADKAGIEPAHRGEIEKISGEYQRERQEVLMELATKDQEQSPNGVRVMVRMNANPKELENPLSPAYKKLSAAKKAAEDKILKVLSPEERDSWTKLQGAPFSFRTDIPGNRF